MKKTNDFLDFCKIIAMFFVLLTVMYVGNMAKGETKSQKYSEPIIIVEVDRPINNNVKSKRKQISETEAKPKGKSRANLVKLLEIHKGDCGEIS